MIKLGSNNLYSLYELAEKFNIKVGELVNLLDQEKVKYVYFADTPYVLESEFLNLFKEVRVSRENNNKVYPVTEKQIMEETIKILHQKKRVTIKELRQYLKEVMSLSNEDLTINKSRKDTKFDQKVRNLVSHRETNGLMKYCDYNNGYLSLKEE